MPPQMMPMNYYDGRYGQMFEENDDEDEDEDDDEEEENDEGEGESGDDEENIEE